MAIALYVGAGAPGAREVSWIGSTSVAPQWLQYGVCLFLLSILSTAGKRTIRLWPILTG